MATSFLMGSDQSPAQDPQNIKPLSVSEETKSESGRSRGRKASNGKGAKKQPQRGLGVAQLERLRIQESLKKKMNQSHETSALHPLSDHQLLQCHPPMPILPFSTLHEPFGSINVLPVQYGAAAANIAHGVLRFPSQVINGNAIVVSGQGQGPSPSPMIGNKSALSVVGLDVGACSGIDHGWMVPNQVNRVDHSYGFGSPVWSPLVGNPLETSKELSSMPNLYSHSQPCDFCLKKKRSNEDNVDGSNARRDSSMNPEFLGLITGPAPNLVGETIDFFNRPTRHTAAAASYATRNLDECMGVVAVHRKGNPISGRVFMEYDFFPQKDGRGTSSKELKLPTIGSVAVGGEGSSSISATGYGDPASTSIDLSLKLS